MPEAQREPSPKPAPAAFDWRRLHLWQIQPIRDALVVAAIVGLVYVGKVVSIVTVPILLALLFAYLFEPLVRRVTATKHVSRQGAALGIILIAGVLVIVPVVMGAVVGVVQGASVAGSIAQNAGDLLKAVDNEAPEAERRAAYLRLDQGFWRWSSDNLTRLRREIKEFKSHREQLRQGGDKPPSTPADPSALKPPSEPGSDPSRIVLPAEPPSAAEAAPAEAAPADGPNHEPPDDGAGPPHSAPPADIPAWKEQFYTIVDSTLTWIRTNNDELAQTIGKRALGSTGQIITAVLGMLGSVGFLLFGAFITAFFFFFFSTGWGRVLDFWESMIPEKRKGRVIELVEKMDGVIAGFVRGRLTICFILSIYTTAAYLLIGVPSAFLLGPLVGLLFMIPYVHVIGVPIAITLMSLEPSGVSWQNAWWWIVFAPIGVYMGAQILDDYVLSPAIQGKNTNMDTPTIVFASLAGGALAGVYGLLIAIPVAACIKILFREVLIPRIHEWAHGKKPDILPIEN